MKEIHPASYVLEQYVTEIPPRLGEVQDEVRHLDVVARRFQIELPISSFYCHWEREVLALPSHCRSCEAGQKQCWGCGSLGHVGGPGGVTIIISAVLDEGV